MADDISVELWMDRRKLAALERVLKESGTDAQTVMQARFDELYRQYVPVQERIDISNSIESERLEAERRAEESRKLSAFHVTESGKELYFTTDDAPEFLMAAIRLREYLSNSNSAPQASFAEKFSRREEISADEFDYLLGVRLDNTGKVAGVYDIDFDKREFSAVNVMDGWKTFAMDDVSTAAYHAVRKTGLTTEQR